MLPKEVSPFEEEYLKRINTIAQWFFAAHLPVFTLVAWANDTGPLMALALTALALVPVFLSSRVLDSPRAVSITMGFSAMMMGGLLVHFGQGPVQIEMHFRAPGHAFHFRKPDGHRRRSPQMGKLKLSTRVDAEGLVVSITDDGKGIDWNMVANKAQSLGIPANDQNDLVEALFSEGMSTKDQVTSYSGRGVGMGAVREACKERQGQVKVHSTKGEGTVFEFRFPRDQMQQVRQASLPPPSTIDVA